MKQRIDNGLQAMVEKAVDFRGRGIAVLLIENAFFSWTPGMRLVTDYQRQPDPDMIDDAGSNYIAIAWAKVAQMVSTDLPSGEADRKAYFGEVPYRGGVMIQIGATRYFAAFSGCTEEQDVEIAKAGLAVLTEGIGE